MILVIFTLLIGIMFPIFWVSNAYIVSDETIFQKYFNYKISSFSNFSFIGLFLFLTIVLAGIVLINSAKNKIALFAGLGCLSGGLVYFVYIMYKVIDYMLYFNNFLKSSVISSSAYTYYFNPYIFIFSGFFLIMYIISLVVFFKRLKAE